VDEFTFIRDHLAKLSGDGAHGLTDDCAYIEMGQGRTLVISTDTSVEGVHFPKKMRGASASERAMRVALSDLAAKGAKPTGYFVNLTLPRDLDDLHVRALAQGLSDAKDAFGGALLGGDTTRHDGPLIITVTALGEIGFAPPLRGNTKVGEQIWLSGPIGDAALGLRYVQGHPPLDNPSGQDLYLWENAYLRPEPRFDVQAAIEHCATAAIDISDGLIADAGHIARASAVKLQLLAGKVPLSGTSERYIGGDQARLIELLTAGDDYQVLICAKPEAQKWLYDSPFEYIGKVAEGEGVELLDVQGEPIPIARAGYKH
jgi:thiamine-monophosphate kinase